MAVGAQHAAPLRISGRGSSVASTSNSRMRRPRSQTARHCAPALVRRRCRTRSECRRTCATAPPRSLERPIVPACRERMCSALPRPTRRRSCGPMDTTGGWASRPRQQQSCYFSRWDTHDVSTRLGDTTGDVVASWMSAQGTGSHHHNRSEIDRLGAGRRNSGYVRQTPRP